MDEFNILLESTVKMEPVKEEPCDNSYESEQTNLWNYSAKEDLSTSNSLALKEEDELRPPVAVWLEDGREEDGEEEVLRKPPTEDPLMSCIEAGRGDQIKTENTQFPQGSSQVKAEPGDLVSCKTEPKEPITLEDGQSQKEQVSIQTSPEGGIQSGEHSSSATPDKPSALNTSPNRHAAEKLFECAVCSRRFLRKCYLGNHMRAHREQSRECSLTKKRLCVKHHFASQIHSHTEGKQELCPLCGKKFSHKHVCLDKGRNSIKCSLCEKWLSRKEHLIRHMRTHTGEKPYECAQCSKKFSLKQHLKYHLIIHSTGNPHLCSVCGRSFSKEQSLLEHLLKHERDKPYRCSVCDMRFAKTGCLNRHKRVHTGEKSIECFKCGKRFSRKDHLAGHMRIHTGEKPFECSVCMKKFIDKQKLKSHIHTHIGVVH